MRRFFFLIFFSCIDYNMFDEAPRCRAQSPPLCAPEDVFSDAVERLLINDINTLRFGTEFSTRTREGHRESRV